jgi:ubiquinone/menaquinone biosynthesis C-methylase UbiE
MTEGHEMKKVVDYSLITESPGLQVTAEQLARLYHRYRFVKDYGVGKDILEAACGSGIGLGFLAQSAMHMVGGDINKANVAVAKQLYRHHDRILLLEMDAHRLPFGVNSFDVILLFEALYYLEQPHIFVKEAFPLLRSPGHLMICTVNKDWSDFHPSPYTYRYFSAPELYDLMAGTFSKVELYGAFSTQVQGALGKMVQLLKRFAVQFHLIPGTLAARAYLKRLFIGPLQPLPEQIYEGIAFYEPPVKIAPDQVNRDYKIIYAVAAK